jgi:hydroxymethylbilane synthase
MPPIVLGTRGSPLALVQTEEVLQALRRRHPHQEFIVRVVKTTGDVNTRDTLTALGRGVFSREIEDLLLRREIDIAVHSLKDLPGTLPPGLVIAATPERADPRDVVVGAAAPTLAALPPGAKVGTSSPRRMALVQEARKDVCAEPIRGNVDTRLRKLKDGAYDAVVLAAAGLARLNRLNEATEFLDPNTFVPAISQGVLGVETREDAADVRVLLAPLDHPATSAATVAERSFLRAVGGGCKVPVAAYATVAGSELTLRGLVATPDGFRVYRRTLHAPVSDAGRVGRELVSLLRSDGAKDLLVRES